VLGLRELQMRFFRSIAATPGPDASARFDPDLLQVLSARGGLGGAARLDVYAQMYWGRLHDVLHDDFPRLAAHMGRARFTGAVLDYLSANPSAHPSVRHVGDRFAEFIATRPDVQETPVLADLARLEWARVEVFDAPDVAPLGADALGTIPVDAWPHQRFAVIPAIRLLDSAWPVHAVWLAGGAGDLPRTATAGGTRIRVWRSGAMIQQATMDAAEDAMLRCAMRGEPFATMCEAVVPLVGAERAAGDAAACLLRWIEDGILAALPGL